MSEVGDRTKPVDIPRPRTAPDPITRVAAPDVTVVVPVYNTMPYLTRCLTSLVEQTIGAGRMEVIAVDDGSTDGGGHLLDRFARRHPELVRVIHQQNSGGPAGPCNRGLELAAGRYVFFVGADDYLGREALARLVDAADRYGSDVVLGRAVGVNNRYVHRAVYARTEPAIDLFDPDSGLRWALANFKLFRRELIERHGLRYPEDMPVNSDQPFTLEAIYRARRVTVLADYDFYYAVRRLNAGNITYSTRHLERLRSVTALMDFVAALIEPGERRDTILFRHFSWELAKLLGDDFARLDREIQESVHAGVGDLVKRYLTDDIRGHLDIEARVRLLAARDGTLDELVAAIRHDAKRGVPPMVVDGDRRYAGYPEADGAPVTTRDGWRDVTDAAAGWLAKLDAVSAETAQSRRAARVVIVTARSPHPDLGALVTAPVRIIAEHLAAHEVSTTSTGDGTVVRAEFRLDSFVAASAPLGHRWNLRVQVTTASAVGSAALRGPLLRSSVRALCRHGGRIFLVAVVRDQNGHVLIAVTPLTPRWVIARLRRAAGRVTAARPPAVKEGHGHNLASSSVNSASVNDPTVSPFFGMANRASE